MKWRISGVDRKTKMRTSLVVDATSEDDALRQALGLGIKYAVATLPEADARKKREEAALLESISEPIEEAAAERTTSLITIKGNPAWVIGTIALSAALFAIGWWQFKARNPDRPLPATQQVSPESTDATVELKSTTMPAGLGWSVKAIEAAWEPDFDWQWFERIDNPDGPGIRFTARPAVMTDFMMQVAGEYQDISEFRAGCAFPNGPVREEEAVLRILVPCHMAALVAGMDAEALAMWAADAIDGWNEIDLTIGRTETTNGRIITLSAVDIEDADAMLLIFDVRPARW